MLVTDDFDVDTFVGRGEEQQAEGGLDSAVDAARRHELCCLTMTTTT